MKILLIDKFHYRFGGAERAYFDTARTLEENGHEVAFFAMQHEKNEKTKWSKFFVSGVSYERTELSFMQKAKAAIAMIWNWEAQERLEALLDEFCPDVVHMHLIYHQLSPSIIWTLKKRGIPMVMTLHDYKHISPNYNLFVRGKIWERAPWRCVGDRCVRGGVSESIVCTLEHYIHKFMGTFKKVNVFIAPSKFLINQYRRHHFEKEITYVPQPLSPQEHGKGAITKKDDYILYLGRLSEEKGLRVLIAGFVASSAKQLVIAGTGPDVESLKKYARQMSASDRIRFVGHQSGSALLDLTQQAQAIVIPSLWYENAPYALLEALAAGSLVIAARSGGITERIEDGINGFLYAPHDSGVLARIINRLEYIDQENMRKRARASVESLTMRQYHDDLMCIYKRAIHDAHSQKTKNVA